jgi:hypothetical protein
MARRKPINLSTMKTQLTLIAALLMIVITSCNKDCDCDDDKPPVDESYPFLRIVNDNTNEATLTSVRMLNYEFDNLNIEIGESQMFTLEEGMPGGYENINVRVAWSRSTWQNGSENAEFNFGDGDITTVAFKGCISFGGCEGFYLE